VGDQGEEAEGSVTHRKVSNFDSNYGNFGIALPFTTYDNSIGQFYGAMKSGFTYLLGILGLGFAITPVVGEFSLGINRTNGSLISTDMWRSHEYEAMAKDSGRQLNAKTGRLTDEPGAWRYRSVFVLGQVFELAADGTNMQVTLILGLYTRSGNRGPAQLTSHVWVEASIGQKLVGAAYYGYASGYPNHFEDHQPLSLVEIEPIRREKTKSGVEDLWIFKLSCSVTLQKPADFIPDLYIDAAFGITSLPYKVRGTEQLTPASKLRQELVLESTPLRTNHPVAVVSAAVKRPQPQKGDELPNQVVLPGVVLSIERQGDELLITYSPTVSGANLEEAEADVYPWVWQKATVASRQTTNGWYVVPTPTPRVFRVSLDR